MVGDDLPDWLRAAPRLSDDDLRRWEQCQAEKEARIDRWVGQMLAGVPTDDN